MRTFEYLLMIILLGAATIYGATAVAEQISSSINNSADLFEEIR